MQSSLSALLRRSFSQVCPEGRSHSGRAAHVSHLSPFRFACVGATASGGRRGCTRPPRYRCTQPAHRVKIQASRCGLAGFLRSPWPSAPAPQSRPAFAPCPSVRPRPASCVARPRRSARPQYRRRHNALALAAGTRIARPRPHIGLTFIRMLKNSAQWLIEAHPFAQARAATGQSTGGRFYALGVPVPRF